MAIEEIHVENEFENRMLKRREMRLLLEHEKGTASREEIRQAIANKLNLKPENMVIVRAEQLYGTHKTRVLIHEYADKESMKIAQKHVLSRPNKKEKKQEVTATAQATVPKEEKKK